MATMVTCWCSSCHFFATKFLQLPDKQYYATVISALALKKQWAEVCGVKVVIVKTLSPISFRSTNKKKIERLCTVKSVFASSKLQPRISAKLLVLLLIAAHAPPDVMSKYLKLLTDSEEKFRLAHSCGCYTVAIDVSSD